MPAFERISSGFGTLGFVGVIWIDSYSPRTQALLGLAVVRRIVSTSIEMLQSGRIRTTQKTLGKHPKVRFLSSPLQNQRFSQGFSHFWPIALEFCSAHATRCMAPAALYFASRTENRVVFRVARVVKTLGFGMFRSDTYPRRWRE